MAIEKPALIGTQCPPGVLLAGVCAIAAVLTSSISASRKKNFFVIFSLLKNRSQEVVPVILLQPGSH